MTRENMLASLKNSNSVATVETTPELNLQATFKARKTVRLEEK